MNDTNPKVVDVRKAFDALPKKGRLVECDGKIASKFDFNTHIQGLAPYRTLHFLTYSESGMPAGRLLIVDRTPGSEKLAGQLQLPVLSSSRPFYFHPGGSQVIGDCLVLPAETGEGQSFVLFMDISDPVHIHEVNPAVRLERPFNDAGAVGITNLTAGRKRLLGARRLRQRGHGRLCLGRSVPRHLHARLSRGSRGARVAVAAARH